MSTSRSRKILSLIHNEDNKIPAQSYDTQAICDASNKLEHDTDIIQTQSTDVLMLSNVRNNPENDRYLNAAEYFQHTESHKKPLIDYRVSPINSEESDADLSDGDPTFIAQDGQWDKRLVISSSSSSYKQQDFYEVCVRNRRTKMLPLHNIIPVKAYSGKQDLSENKKKDLRELISKNLIPHFYSDFYDTIL